MRPWSKHKRQDKEVDSKAFSKGTPKVRPPTWIRVAAPVVVVLLVVLVVGLAEVVLRLGGYGVPGHLFEESGMPGYLILHNDYYRRFHPRTEPSRRAQSDRFNPFLMANPKPDDVLRIFVIGGSTAKGFPHHDQYSFSNIAGMLLNSRLDGRRVEVINLSHSAMSSYYVRETARRCWRYEPDLLLIYSGHNEYFGTIGAGSGHGHRRKLLYMRLKDLRLFQWLMNLMQPAAQGSDPGDLPMTLMARRLAGGHFPQDEVFDRVVADRFIDNLEAIRRGAERRNIPLVILDPVCNLLDMPPFDGLHTDELDELIMAGIEAFASDTQNRQAWLQAVAAVPAAHENAHLIYLSALASTQDGDIKLDGFLAAKDADTLPFRAREALRSALAAWADKHAGSVFYIPLQREMAARRGAPAFSDEFFIDHLHFSHLGQLLVGRITAAHLLSMMTGTNDSDNEQWPSDEEMRARLNYHPSMDVSALLKIRDLLRNSPFRDMRIPYQGRALLSGLRNNPLMRDEQLRRRLLVAGQDQELAIIGQHLQNQERHEELIQMLHALVAVNPGNHYVHHNLAVYLNHAGSKHPQLLGAYQRAYLLSHRDAHIRREMEAFAYGAGLGSELQRFFRQIGE